MSLHLLLTKFKWSFKIDFAFLSLAINDRFVFANDFKTEHFTGTPVAARKEEPDPENSVWSPRDSRDVSPVWIAQTPASIASACKNTPRITG